MRPATGWSPTLAPVELTGLKEGDWRLVVEREHDDARQFLEGALCDQRGALSPAAWTTTAGGIHQHLPYVTKEGTVGLRVWCRPRHAEVTVVTVKDARITVTLRLFGIDPCARIRVALRRRGAPAEELSCEAVTCGPGRLSFDIEMAELACRRLREHDVWDVWVVEEESRHAARVARVLDDILDKKRVLSYALTMLDDATGKTVRSRPFFTVGNEFSVNVVDVSH